MFDIQFSDFVEQFQPGIFTVLDEKKHEFLQAGRKVYNLSVGTPDFKPAPHVMEAMTEACQNPDNYKYALADLPELLEAVQTRYEKRFGVRVETDHICLWFSGGLVTHRNDLLQSWRLRAGAESGLSVV